MLRRAVSSETVIAIEPDWQALRLGAVVGGKLGGVATVVAVVAV